MPFKDIQKKNEYRREWYRNNSLTGKESVRKRKIKIKKWFYDYKSLLSCSICSESHPAIIDFHHKGNKREQVAQMAHYGYSIESIKKEMEKCDILCANCHRKLHWKKQKPLKRLHNIDK
jgi:hypothetical protein